MTLNSGVVVSISRITSRDLRSNKRRLLHTKSQDCLHRSWRRLTLSLVISSLTLMPTVVGQHKKALMADKRRASASVHLPPKEADRGAAHVAHMPQLQARKKRTTKRHKSNLCQKKNINHRSLQQLKNFGNCKISCKGWSKKERVSQQPSRLPNKLPNPQRKPPSYQFVQGRVLPVPVPAYHSYLAMHMCAKRPREAYAPL
ncbi:hypothetical protein BDA96_06G240100 [Sorghum bicolor]|uniref:Uncharacterized protein n=2 Tax=Sorghum bicolor TaxID=4558 RepID=A0A921QTH3_SORBI|nr:hypothetical protein BDA96_06G240100 [Sorghum bicolor]KXG27064.2 hypothetical protein SORBI_3006G219250 [Sorghum bicolor]